MARAILRKSSIVVLDEATSALDASTEKSLLKAISIDFENKTVIVIAVNSILKSSLSPWKKDVNIMTSFFINHLYLFTFQHRVSALLDCDRVIVLHDGKIVEDGSPVDLTRQQDSFFANMLKSNEENETNNCWEKNR